MNFKSQDRRAEGGTLLRQCQLAELYLLDVFVEICDKFHLRYFLDSGTLLGAVRHRGFIPWDDDIDVGMPIEDFNRFIEIADRELPENILLEKPDCFVGRPETFAKLRDRCSFFCETSTNVQSPCGLYIDIFPFCEYPQRPKWLVSMLAKMGTVARRSYEAHLKLSYTSPFSLFVASIKSSIWRLLGRSMLLLTRLLAVFSSVKWRYCQGMGFAFQLGISNDDMFPLSEVEFEGAKYKAPHRPEAMLAAYYGDWQTLPPQEKRVWHSSIVCPTQAPNAPWARKYGSVGTDSIPGSSI